MGGRPLGANRINDFFMGNSTPSGSGQGSWVPSNKNAGKRSGGFKAKSFSSQGNSSSGSYSFGGRSSASGLYSPATSKIRNSTPTNSYSKPSGINVDINTRGSSPVAKVVGGAVVAQGLKGGIKAFLTKANPYVAAVLLIADIVLGDRGLEANDSPDYWVSNVGERQTVSGEKEPPPYGFRIRFYSTNNRKYLTKDVKSYNIVANPPGSRRTHYIEMVNLNDITASASLDPSTLTEEPIPYPEGQEPEPIPPVQSESNTNHSNIPTPKRATSSNPPPPSIRPPLPSNKIASPAPSKAYDGQPAKPSVVKQATTKTPSKSIESNTSSGSSSNTQQPSINNPSPTPEPLPEPEPPPEKTIEEVEQEVSTEVEEPNIISVTKTKRADGTIENTVRREATEEEMKEFDKKLNDIKLQRERAEKIIEQDRKFREISVDHPELSEDTEFDKFAQEFRDTIDETTYSPFGEVNWYNKSKRSKKTTTNTLPTPEPDATPTPEPLPKPVVQTKVNDNVVEDKINKLPSANDIAIAVAGLDILRQIKDKPLPSFLCQAPTLVPPVAAQARANNVAIGTSQAVITGQNVAIQNSVNAVAGTLVKMQQYAETAWKATRADKVVSALNTMLIIHNGFMLSNNLLSTVSEVAEIGLEALGIRDEEDEPIDIGQAIGNRIDIILTNWLGSGRYTELTNDLAKKMRIYQSGANVVYNLRNLVDAGHDIAETTAEHVAFIGNALRRDGVVRENSYRLMPVDYNPSSRLLYRLEKANDAVEIIEDIASEVKDISEEIGDLKENAKTFADEFEKVSDDRQSEESDDKAIAQSTLEPTEEDEQRGIVNGEE